MRPSLRAVVVLAIPVLASCAPSFDGFGKTYGTAFCKYAKECLSTEFNTQYSSLSACIDDQELAYDGNKPGLSNCDYDKKRAADCIAATNKAARTCDAGDVADADTTCSLVFDCGGGAGFDTF